MATKQWFQGYSQRPRRWELFSGEAPYSLRMASARWAAVSSRCGGGDVSRCGVRGGRDWGRGWSCLGLRVARMEAETRGVCCAPRLSSPTSPDTCSTCVAKSRSSRAMSCSSREYAVAKLRARSAGSSPAWIPMRPDLPPPRLTSTKRSGACRERCRRSVMKLKGFCVRCLLYLSVLNRSSSSSCFRSFALRASCSRPTVSVKPRGVEDGGREDLDTESSLQGRPGVQLVCIKACVIAVWESARAALRRGGGGEGAVRLQL